MCLIFPTVDSNEASIREASAKHVDKYVASIQDRLRTTLWGAQAQSTVEAYQQKLVLQQKDRCSELETWQPGTSEGRCFLRERERSRIDGEEDSWEVVHQVMTDVPSYEVMIQNSKSWVLHWNWLLLIASEVGVSLMYRHLYCMAQGVPAPCHARLPLQEVRQR